MTFNTVRTLYPLNSATQSGFGLIEVMITLLITSIAMTALMTMTVNSMKAEKGVESLVDYSTLQDRIRMFASNPNLCSSMIGDTGTHSLNLAGELITEGTRLSSGSTITRVSLHILAATPTPNEFSAYIELEGTKNPVSIGGLTLKAVQLPVTVLTNGTPTIVSCNLVSLNGPATCIALGGVWQQHGSSGNWYCNLN